jgi:hypothetical protein
MLIPSTDLLNLPVLSLRSGSKLATVSKLIINPYDLTIQALKLTGRQLDNPKDSYLLPEDIREISHLGIIINDSEDLVSSVDVLRLQQTLDLRFELINLPVIDKQRRKVGKVLNYNLIAENMMIYQLVVQRPLFKDFFDPTILIHRSQIAELSQNKVVIKNSLNQLRELERQDAIDSFVNPFRSTKSAKTSK